MIQIIFDFTMNTARRFLPLPIKRLLKPVYLRIMAAAYHNAYSIYMWRLKQIDNTLLRFNIDNINHLKAEIDCENELIGKKIFPFVKKDDTIGRLRESIYKKNEEISKKSDALTKEKERIERLKTAIYSKNEIIGRKSDAFEKRDETIKQLRESIYKKNEQIDKKRAALSKEKKRINRLKAAIESKNELIEKKSIAFERRNSTITQLKDTLYHKNESIKRITRFSPVIRSLKFAEYCQEIEDELKADVYIAHDVLPLLAANVLAYRKGGKIFCNVIEIPSFRSRAAKLPWQDEVFSLIESATIGNLKQCDLLITIGPTLGSKISDLGPPVWVLENYRYLEKLNHSDELRRMCGGLGEGDHLILSISTVATGFEDVLQALKLLPDNYHLATVGKFFPKDYEKTITDLVQSLDLKKRIHFFDFVPYEKLTSVASSADVGLIVRDPEIVNNYVSLPNRVFDYIAAGLPLCSPLIPDIANIINTYRVGSVVEEMTPRGWAAAIKKTVDHASHMKKSALDLASQLTWESRESEIVNKIVPAQKVTFLGMGDLTKNNRTKRIALTLAESGVNVKVLAVSKEQIEPEHENITYHRIPNLFI